MTPLLIKAKLIIALGCLPTYEVPTVEAMDTSIAFPTKTFEVLRDRARQKVYEASVLRNKADKEEECDKAITEFKDAVAHAKEGV